jgi:Flp pilus assembly protein TadD
MRVIKTEMIFLFTVLLFYSSADASTVQRLTDNPTEKPNIVVSAQGTYVAWKEAKEAPAPVNMTYQIYVYDVGQKKTTPILLVPGITSNQSMLFLLGNQDKIKGPHFTAKDLNYRIIGDITQIRLSGDGRYLVTCVEEQYDYTKRNPFFVVVDLQQKSFEVIPVQVPEGLGSITADPITSKMNLMYWDYNPAGTLLAYVLDSVNYRGSTVVLYDIQAKTSRRVLGYERAAYVNGSLTIEGPDDQIKLYGNKLALGDNILVIAGTNAQRKEGLWMVFLSNGNASFNEAPYAVPGVSADHVFFTSQKPAVWLNPDGTEGVVYEQKSGLFNQASVPFWGSSGSAFMADQDHRSIVELGSGDPVPVVQKTEMGVPQDWRFQLRGSSTADSYRLASDNGGTLVLPVSDPRNQRKLDLFIMTREVAQIAGSGSGTGADTEAFSSLVDAFEIGSLLKPGELPGKFMPAGSKTKSQGAALPPLPPTVDLDLQSDALSAPDLDSVDTSLVETAEQAHDQAEMILMLGELDDATLANAIERLEKAVELDPENRQYRLDLALGYVAANTMLSMGAAIEEYSLLLQKNNRDDDALAGMADAYVMLGNLEEAMEIVYLRTVMNPNDAAIRHSAALQMAVYALDSSDLIGCLTWIRELYDQYPQDSFVKGLIGLLWAMDGDVQRAEAIFQKVIDESPPDDPVRTRIALVKQAMGERRAQ